MHDIVIRGGTIIDGTGKSAFTGDVAIAGDRIVAVGGKQGPARREIDATGLLVTPGWVDVHTHYDGQALWDPLLAPSCCGGSGCRCGEARAIGCGSPGWSASRLTWCRST